MGWEDTSIGALAIALGKYIIPVPAACGFHMSHPIDIASQKSSKNKDILNNILSNEFPFANNYIQNSQKRILEQKILCKSCIGRNPLVYKRPRQGLEYLASLGQYDKIKRSKILSANKYKPNALFLSGDYSKIIKNHNKTLESCLSFIMLAKYKKAAILYNKQRNIQKCYLDKIDHEKLLETAKLWKIQGSFLFAFVYFSLYALHKGFDKRILSQIENCSKQIKNGKLF